MLVTAMAAYVLASYVGGAFLFRALIRREQLAGDEASVMGFLWLLSPAIAPVGAAAWALAAASAAVGRLLSR